METKTTKIEKLMTGVWLGILVFFAATIVVRFLTRQILIEHFGMDNAFTELVWFDNSIAGGFDKDENDSGEEDSSATKDINWEEQYPFDSSMSNLDIAETESSNEKSGLLDRALERVTSAVVSVEDRIETYATDFLIFHAKLVENAYA
jgi:hypothetical protein